ncbi:MAG: Rrf2 family transcriptional regulator [Ginsengibacter sp.]
MFSKACEYGIKAAIYIAEQSLASRKVSLKEIAESTDSPEAFTAKILQKLGRNNIINSEKGPAGGFFMDKVQLNTICLSDIVFTIDGDDIYNGCALGLQNCNDIKPCPVHNKFAAIRDNLKNMLEKTTIQMLARKLKSGPTFLKR